MNYKKQKASVLFSTIALICGCLAYRMDIAGRYEASDCLLYTTLFLFVIVMLINIPDVINSIKNIGR